jgi:hypothetical protein
MRAWVGILFGITIPLWMAPAYAGAFFHYRDGRTGCDAFAEHADQIPRHSRDGALAITEAEARRGRLAADYCARAAEARLARAGDGLSSASAPAPIETSLARKGGRSLTESELAELRVLCSPRVTAYLLALLAALAAWIAVMVAAFREDHFGWAMLMLFLSAPMAFIYLFLALGKDRSRFKAMCALGMLAPVLVFLASVWHILPATPK